MIDKFTVSRHLWYNEKKRENKKMSHIYTGISHAIRLPTQGIKVYKAEIFTSDTGKNSGNRGVGKKINIQADFKLVFFPNLIKKGL
jgi:hypothetical protein